MKIKELEKYFKYANNDIDVIVLLMERYERLLRKAKAFNEIESIVINKDKTFQDMIDKIIER